MSEARALTNLIGNGVATLVVAKWTGDLDVERMKAHLDNPSLEETDEPEVLHEAEDAHMHVAANPARP
jgi:aerobic C4-dicarboxylate transport protein